MTSTVKRGMMETSKPNGSVAILCANCGWRTRRKPAECDCCDEWAMYCHCTWGKCNKCGACVYPTSMQRRWQKQDAAEKNPRVEELPAGWRWLVIETDGPVRWFATAMEVERRPGVVSRMKVVGSGNSEADARAHACKLAREEIATHPVKPAEKGAAEGGG